ncbi:MAG: ATP-binding protein [Oceanidesulfovibrio sp.]
MREIVVLSGKGGTGKTSITAALASCGPPKVLADCDVDAADLHLILEPEVIQVHDFVSGELPVVNVSACTACGLCMEKCRFQAMEADAEGKALLKSELCEGCGMCAYVCPSQAVSMVPRKCGVWYDSETRHGPMIHAALDIGAENSGKLVTTVRQRSGRVAENRCIDVILTDGPPGIGCPVIASLTNADLALIVTEPTRSAVHDLKRIADLAAHFDIPAAVLVNKEDVNPEMAQSVTALCRSRGIAFLGATPYDPAFCEAQLAGRSVVEHAPDKYTPFFEHMWKRLLGEDTYAPSSTTDLKSQL